MNRIDEKFLELKEKNEKALATLIVAGDPDVEFTECLAEELPESGSDVLILGVPFSDPAADGSDVQCSFLRAAQNGTSIFSAFEMLSEMRSKIKIPIILRIYYNIAVQYGLEKFFAKCGECGADGVMIPDLPYEESGEIKEYTDKYGVYNIQSISPSSEDRIKNISKSAEGFLNCIVSDMKDAEKLCQEIRKNSDIPLVFSEKAVAKNAVMNNLCGGVYAESSLVKAVSEAVDADMVCKVSAEMKKKINE